MLKSLSYVIKLDMLLSQQVEEFHRIKESLKEHGLDTEDLVEAMMKVAPSCEDLLVDCVWKSEVIPCDQLFSPRLTDEGLCCSFQSEHDDHGIRKSQSVTPDDMVDEYGIQAALRLLLDPNINDSALISSRFHGFKVLLHGKKDFPDVNKRAFVIGPGMENYAAVNSISVHYTDPVARVSLEKRRCYVDGERHLKYHDNYTRSSCLFECRIERIIKECGCLPHFITGKKSISCRRPVGIKRKTLNPSVGRS